MTIHSYAPRIASQYMCVVHRYSWSISLCTTHIWIHNVRVCFGRAVDSSIHDIWCDAPGPMLDRSSSSACHSSTSFCSRLQKKAASRCISSSCSIHATPTFCTFSYFPPHTPGSSYDHPLFAYFSCVNLLRICIRMGRARCSYLSVPTSSIIWGELYLSVQIQKKKGIYVLGTCWSMLTTCQMQALRSRL